MSKARPQTIDTTFWNSSEFFKYISVTPFKSVHHVSQLGLDYFIGTCTDRSRYAVLTSRKQLTLDVYYNKCKIWRWSLGWVSSIFTVFGLFVFTLDEGQSERVSTIIVTKLMLTSLLSLLKSLSWSGLTWQFVEQKAPYHLVNLQEIEKNWSEAPHCSLSSSVSQLLTGLNRRKCWHSSYD